MHAVLALTRGHCRDNYSQIGLTFKISQAIQPASFKSSWLGVKIVRRDWVVGITKVKLIRSVFEALTLICASDDPDNECHLRVSGAIMSYWWSIDRNFVDRI